MEVTELPLSAIRVSEFNTRKDMDAGTEDAGIQDLAVSIRENGLIQPITVREDKEGLFDLIAGQRRLQACQELGWQTIPAIVHDNVGDEDATVVSLVENVHRAEMNPIDKARAYQAILDHYGNVDDVSRRAGVTVQTVRKYLQLLRLAPSILPRIGTRQGPAGVSAMSRLAQMFPPEQQEEALRLINGFKQDIQIKIITESGGDLGELAALRTQAMEGAFDTRACHDGLCFNMPPAMKAEIQERLAHHLRIAQE